MDVDGLLDTEVRLARERRSAPVLTRGIGEDGESKLVVTTETTARGESAPSDSSEKAWIAESGNVRVYEFDPQTKMLDSLKVYKHTGRDVLLFEMMSIEYGEDTGMAPDVFSPPVPEEAVWVELPQKLGEEYQQMQPEEVARAFLEACAEQDWDEASRYWWCSAVHPYLKKGMSRLTIISIGTPFKSGIYPGWYVPCEVKRWYREPRRLNLAVRRYEPAQRYIVDGVVTSRSQWARARQLSPSYWHTGVPKRLQGNGNVRRGSR
jgi:hypothetical protein